MVEEEGNATEENLDEKPEQDLRRRYSYNEGMEAMQVVKYFPISARQRSCRDELLCFINAIQGYPSSMPAVEGFLMSARQGSCIHTYRIFSLIIPFCMYI